jgi:20S proteasome subunit beta 5
MASWRLLASYLHRLISIFPRNIIATMAGGAADCSQFIRRTAAMVKIIEANMALEVPVKMVARILAQSMRNNRGSELSVGTMISGWDSQQGRFSIYYVDSEGTCVDGDVFCVGSGGILAYGILDSGFRDVIAKKLKGRNGSNESKECNDRPEDRDMTVEEAVQLAVRAIRCATHRDSYSGGYINVFYLSESGAFHVYREDSRKINVPFCVTSSPDAMI